MINLHLTFFHLLDLSFKFSLNGFKILHGLFETGTHSVVITPFIFRVNGMAIKHTIRIFSDPRDDPLTITAYFFKIDLSQKITPFRNIDPSMLVS